MEKTYSIAPFKITNTADYFCITPYNANTTITLHGGSNVNLNLKYSYNRRTWYNITDVLVLPSNYVWTTSDSIYFKGKNTLFSGTNTQSEYGNTYFEFSDFVALSGDMTSIVCGYCAEPNKIDCIPGIGSTSRYSSGLFTNNTKIKSVKDLKLSFKNGTYGSMFKDCTALLDVPQISSNIYYAYHMFYGAGIVDASSLTVNLNALYEGYSTNYNFGGMFNYCTSLTKPCKVSGSNGRQANSMFANCTALNTLPKLPATLLYSNCYNSMFSGCSLIKLSETQTGEYVNEYRIPFTGTGETDTGSSNWTKDMFKNTGGTFTGTPDINTTYYTSNEVI